jgi:hypothetical protein
MKKRLAEIMFTQNGGHLKTGEEIQCIAQAQSELAAIQPVEENSAWG